VGCRWSPEKDHLLAGECAHSLRRLSPPRRPHKQSCLRVSGRFFVGCRWSLQRRPSPRWTISRSHASTIVCGVSSEEMVSSVNMHTHLSVRMFVGSGDPTNNLAITRMHDCLWGVLWSILFQFPDSCVRVCEREKERVWGCECRRLLSGIHF